MDKQTSILKLLFEKERTHYRDIVDLSNIHNPNVVRRELNELKRKRLIKEEGRKNWKPGKKIFYSLTKKGEETTFNTVLNGLNEVLRIIERMLSKFLSEPDKIEKWRKAAREKMLREPPLTEDMPLETVLSLVKEQMDKIYGPLTKSLWLMHQIIIKQLGFPYPKDVFIHVSEEGGITMIPRALLNKKGRDWWSRHQSSSAK